jgi:hypothetical protein
MLESNRNRHFLPLVALLLGVATGLLGCMTAYKKSVGANTLTSFNRVYTTDFNTAWQAVLDAMKSIRLDVTNREAGFLQSRWMDNTKEKNFSDGDGSTAPYMRAQYRFKVSVAKGIYNKVSAVKVSVQREQFAQRDALDENHPLESDSIEENTLLYRIGRIIAVKTRLTKLEEYQTKLEIQKAAAATSSDDTSAPPPPANDSTSNEDVPPPPPPPEASSD